MLKRMTVNLFLITVLVLTTFSTSGMKRVNACADSSLAELVVEESYSELTHYPQVFVLGPLSLNLFQPALQLNQQQATGFAITLLIFRLLSTYRIALPPPGIFFALYR